MSKYKETKEIEKKKGIMAETTNRERAKINKNDVSNLKCPDLSKMKCIPIYRDKAPKNSRPIGYIFKNIK